jgi:hypothetical protein
MPRRTRPHRLFLIPLAVLALDACARGSQPPQTTAASAPTTASAPAAPADTTAAPLAPEAVDAAVRAAWEKEGVHPAPAVDDARFLRRVYLDLTGVIPPPEAVTAFLADTSPDKRRKVIDALLASPRWADNFTNYWDRVLLGREVKGPFVDRDAFRDWLHGELSRNTPYDRMVRELITANGVSSEGDAGDDDDDLPGMGPRDGGAAGGNGRVNGAVNWLVKLSDMPQDLAGATSRLFLGVQIQCAQCHDHKTEAWKTDDFRRFAASFAETRVEPIDPPRMGKKRRVEVRDAGMVVLKKRKQDPEIKAIAEAKPRALDGTDLSKAASPRAALAKWMTSPQNPWFAKAAVNRVWAHFLGRGFVDPITDFRPSNPATLPDVLDLIARDFVAGGYDVKRLMRLVCNTEVYQRAAPKAKLSPAEEKLWAGFHVEPLGPDALLDSIVAAVDLEGVLGQRAAGRTVDDVKRARGKQFGFLFDVDEESDAPDFEGSIPQALFLMNDGFVNNNGRAAPGSALARILDMPGGDADKITALYLRTLSRPPSPEEVATWKAFVAPPRDDLAGARADKARPRKARKQAYEDLLWALLNSSEFTFNH